MQCLSLLFRPMRPRRVFTHLILDEGSIEKNPMEKKRRRRRACRSKSIWSSFNNRAEIRSRAGMSRQNRAKGGTERNGHRKRGGGDGRLWSVNTYWHTAHNFRQLQQRRKRKEQLTGYNNKQREREREERRSCSYHFRSSPRATGARSTHYRGAPFIYWPINQIVRLSSKKCLYTHIGYDILDWFSYSTWFAQCHTLGERSAARARAETKGETKRPSENDPLLGVVPHRHTHTHTKKRRRERERDSICHGLSAMAHHV